MVPSAVVPSADGLRSRRMGAVRRGSRGGSSGRKGNLMKNPLRTGCSAAGFAGIPRRPIIPGTQAGTRLTARTSWEVEPPFPATDKNFSGAKSSPYRRKSVPRHGSARGCPASGHAARAGRCLTEKQGREALSAGRRPERWAGGYRFPVKRTYSLRASSRSRERRCPAG